MAGFSKYPNQIDSSLELPPSTDNVTPVKAEVVNRLRDAILAIESELGIDPSREYGTVRARLDAMQSGGGGGGAIEILQNGVEVLPSAVSLDFVGNVDITISQPLRARIEIIGGQASQVQETLAVNFNGQTLFTLSNDPIEDTGVMMFVDGIKQQRGIDYTSVDTAVTYTGSIPLITSDKVEFWYLIDLGSIGGGGGGAFGNSKIRIYRSASDLAGAAVGVNQTVVWDGVSSLVTADNASVGGGNTQISPLVDGHFVISGQLSIQPTLDAISGIIVEILHNGTVVHTISDYGAIWGIGITRSLSFSFMMDLVSGDTLQVRWQHSGSAPSTQKLILGDKFSWFAISGG